jgi:hypothetical protein
MSLIKEKAPYRVFLNPKIFEDARDREHFKKLLAAYMKNYPHYVVKGIKDGFAICEKCD